MTLRKLLTELLFTYKDLDESVKIKIMHYNKEESYIGYQLAEINRVNPLDNMICVAQTTISNFVKD